MGTLAKRKERKGDMCRRSNREKYHAIQWDIYCIKTETSMQEKKWSNKEEEYFEWTTSE
jgi:hypothetical protein